MSVEERDQARMNYRASQGLYLYADYSPLEEHRNLIELVKEFVRVAASTAGINQDNRKLNSLLSDTDSLRADILAAIKEIQKNTSNTMEKFYETHSEVLATDLLKMGNEVFVETKKSLSGLLDNTQESFLEHHSKYKETLIGQIFDNNHKAYLMTQAWLASDYNNLPKPILSRLVQTYEITIAKGSGNRGNDDKSYKVLRMVSSSTTSHYPTPPQDEGKKMEVQNTNTNSQDAIIPEPLQFSYSFHLNASEIDFWNYRRTVADFGIKDLMLPVGMKEPISEKIRQSFKFGLAKDSEVSKEPQFVKVDDYSIARIIAGDRNLIVELVEDVDKPESSKIVITYDKRSLAEDSQSSRSDPRRQQESPVTLRPRIDYLPSKVEETNIRPQGTDLLQIREIEEDSDLLKIRLFGSALLAKLEILWKPGVVSSKGVLRDLKVRNENILADDLHLADYTKFFDLLESVALAFSPYIKKVKDTTPIPGELMIRQDLGGGQRREFSMRIDEIHAQLGDGDYGTRIISRLGL